MSMRPVFRKARLLVACDLITQLTGLLARCMYICQTENRRTQICLQWLTIIIRSVFSNGLSNINVAPNQNYPEDGNEVSFWNFGVFRLPDTTFSRRGRERHLQRVILHGDARTRAVGNILSDRSGGLMVVEGYHRGAAVCLWCSSSGKVDRDWEELCGE